MLANRQHLLSLFTHAKSGKHGFRMPTKKAAAATMAAVLAGTGSVGWAMSGKPAAAAPEPIKTEPVQSEQKSGHLADLIAAVKPVRF